MPPLPKERILARVDKSVSIGLFHLNDRAEILVIPALLCGDQRTEAVMEIIIPLGIEAVSADLCGIDDPNVVQVALGNDVHVPAKFLGTVMHSLAQFLQKMFCTEIEYPMDRVDPQGIHMKLRHPVERVPDEVAPHFITVGPVKVDSVTPGCSVFIG